MEFSERGSLYFLDEEMECLTERHVFPKNRENMYLFEAKLDRMGLTVVNFVPNEVCTGPSA